MFSRVVRVSLTRGFVAMTPRAWGTRRAKASAVHPDRLGASIGRTKPRPGALRVRSMVLPVGVFASPEYTSNV